MLQRIISTDPGIPLSDQVSRVGSILLPILGFLAPLSGPAGTAVAVVMVLLFFLRGSLGTTLQQILANKIVLAVLVFFVLHLIGLFWTEDIRSGPG